MIANMFGLFTCAVALVAAHPLDTVQHMCSTSLEHLPAIPWTLLCSTLSPLSCHPHLQCIFVHLASLLLPCFSLSPIHLHLNSPWLQCCLVLSCTPTSHVCATCMYQGSQCMCVALLCIGHCATHVQHILGTLASHPLDSLVLHFVTLVLPSIPSVHLFPLGIPFAPLVQSLPNPVALQQPLAAMLYCVVLCSNKSCVEAVGLLLDAPCMHHGSQGMCA